MRVKKAKPTPEEQRREQIRIAIQDLAMRRGEIGQRLHRWHTLRQIWRKELTEAERVNLGNIEPALTRELAQVGEPIVYGGVMYQAMGSRIKTSLPI